MTAIGRIRLLAAIGYALGTLGHAQFALLAAWIPALNSNFGWHPVRDGLLAVAGIAVAVFAATYAEQIGTGRRG